MKSTENYLDILKAPFDDVVKSIEYVSNKASSIQEETLFSLNGYMDAVALLKRYRESLNTISYQFDINTLASIIMNELQKEYYDWLEPLTLKEEEIFLKIDALADSINQERASEVQTKQSAIQQVKSSLEALQSKRSQLMCYSDTITDKCYELGLDTSHIQFVPDMFTVDELDNLYDEYIESLSTKEKLSNPVRLLRSTLNDPVFESILIAVIIALCFSKVLTVFAVAFYIYLFTRQFKSKSDLDYYAVLFGVLYTIDPADYFRIDNLEPVIEEVDVDTDPRFSEFLSSIDSIEDEINSKDPMDSTLAMQEFNKNRQMYIDAISKYTSDTEELKTALIADIDSLVEKADKWYKDEIAKIPKLGDSFTTSCIWNSNFTLGLNNGVPETVDIGQRNIIVRPGSDENMLDWFMKVLYINMLCNTRLGYVTTYVYDPNNMGQTYMPFYHDYLNKHLVFVNDDLPKVLKDLQDYAEKNLKDMRGSDIASFNKDCEETGRTPKEYRLLIILSQPKSVEDNEAISHFMDYSVKCGVFIWVVSRSMNTKNTYLFRKPFEGVKSPYPEQTGLWITQLMEMYVSKLKELKPKALMWGDFVNNVIPENKIWKGCANEFIDLYPGYLDGDPNLHSPYTVGNEGNVHTIAVGGTGAGKSVFLNHLIATVTREYDPNEVELWLCDFKGTEFKFYLPSEKYPFMLPHIKACLCTSDGDYATSLFHAIRTMADRRYDVMKTPSLEYPGEMDIPSQKNMLGWNKYWQARYEASGDEKYLKRKWPRVLFICDEFQVIFEKADDKNLTSINADITQLAKVARACGVHIFFTSQSMKKTISDDILQQFTLRFALRCDEEVSMSVLGSKNASSIREKNGYLYVRSLEMKKPEDQKRYKTPYIPDEDKPDKMCDLRQHVKDMYDRAKELPNFEFRDVITYEEATVHPDTDLEERLCDERLSAKVQEGTVPFLMGERMVYSENRAPINFVIGKKNNSNVFSCFSDYEDLYNFFNTMMTNQKLAKEETSTFINCQISDLNYLLNTESFATEGLQYFCSEKTSIYEAADWIQGLYEYRKGFGTDVKHKPVFIYLIGWDKALGFGIDVDYSIKDKIVTLMQIAGEYHIHFVFINTTQGGFGPSVSKACKIKVAGKCPEQVSFELFDSKIASKIYESMKNGYMFVDSGDGAMRCKTYRYPITRTIVKDELVL